MGNKLIGLAGLKGSGKDSTFVGFYGYNLVKTTGRRFRVKSVADFCSKHIKVKYIGTEDSILNVLQFYFHKLFGKSFDTVGDLDYLCIEFFNEVKKSKFSNYLYATGYDLYEIEYDLSSNVIRIAFADILKVMCMSIFGLDFESCFGSQENKSKNIGVDDDGRPFTARELLQFIGTDIMRDCIRDDVWYMYVLERLLPNLFTKWSGCEDKLVFITDCRFENEFDAIHSSNGKVVFLNRFGDSNDKHRSEQECLSYNGYDLVVNNTELTIVEQCIDIAYGLELKNMVDRNVWDLVQIEG